MKPIFSPADAIVVTWRLQNSPQLKCLDPKQASVKTEGLVLFNATTSETGNQYYTLYRQYFDVHRQCIMNSSRVEGRHRVHSSVTNLSNLDVVNDAWLLKMELRWHWPRVTAGGGTHLHSSHIWMYADLFPLWTLLPRLEPLCIYYRYIYRVTQIFLGNSVWQHAS